MNRSVSKRLTLQGATKRLTHGTNSKFESSKDHCFGSIVEQQPTR